MVVPWKGTLATPGGYALPLGGVKRPGGWGLGRERNVPPRSHWGTSNCEVSPFRNCDSGMANPTICERHHFHSMGCAWGGGPGGCRPRGGGRLTLPHVPMPWHALARPRPGSGRPWPWPGRVSMHGGGGGRGWEGRGLACPRGDAPSLPLPYLAPPPHSGPPRGSGTWRPLPPGRRGTGPGKRTGPPVVALPFLARPIPTRVHQWTGTVGRWPSPRPRSPFGRPRGTTHPLGPVPEGVSI